MNDGIFLILVVISIVGFIIRVSSGQRQSSHLNQRQRSSDANQTGVYPRKKSEEEEAYSELLNLVRGDKGVAERLIDIERKKFPNAKRLELIRIASDRIRHY